MYHLKISEKHLEKFRWLLELAFYVEFHKRNNANVAYTLKCMVFDLITPFIDFNAYIVIQCRK